MVISKKELRKEILERIGYGENVEDGKPKYEQTKIDEDVRILQALTDGYKDLNRHNMPQSKIKKKILLEVYSDPDLDKHKYGAKHKRLLFIKEDYRRILGKVK